MSLYAKQNFLVKNSKGQFFNFYINSNSGISCDLFDENRFFKSSTQIIDVDILDFSVDIDKNDRIHLLSLTKDGKLIYYIYSNKNLSENFLTNLDIKSNTYRYITLKVTKEDIHIFYSFCNMINPNVWTIQHIIGNKKKWERKNIISITPGKFMSPFYVDFDKLGNIHLVYKNNVNGTQHIFYTSFNPFLKNWIRNPQMISNSDFDNLHPYMFVDNRNTIHVVWSSLNNSNLQLVYKQCPALNNQKNKWKNFNLPDIHGNCTHPVIFEDVGLLRILYRQNNLLKGLYSKDWGFSWSLDRTIENMNLENSKFIKFATNYPAGTNKLKINHIYGKINDTINLYCIGTYKKKVIDNIKYFSASNQYTSDNNITNSIESVKFNHNNTKSTDESKKDNIERNKSSDIIPKKIKHKETTNMSINEFSLSENLNSFEDENIKEFIRNTKLKLDIISTNTKHIHKLKNDIEKLIFDNAKLLERKTMLNKKDYQKVINQLENLNVLIKKYKEEYTEILQILSTTSKKYDDNLNEINKIESQISEIKNIIENSQKYSVFEKILKIFK